MRINFLLALFLSLLLTTPNAYCENIQQTEKQLYPDYANMFLGKDKFEKFNRKMFKFNLKMNKYVLKPVHVVWASVMPKYGMDRIQSMYSNIEYPKRAISTILQRDFKSLGHETVRFLTNTTLGIGGMYDAADYFFKLEPYSEDVAQGLKKCKVPQGSYLVLPFINSTTPRSILGSLIECPLDPSMYISSPITAMVKAGLLVNRTSYMQPLAKSIELNFADPYDIVKKMYGLERYIKENNLDRRKILQDAMQRDIELVDNTNEQLLVKNDEMPESDRLIVDDALRGHTYFDTAKDDLNLTDNFLRPDIFLENFKPQCPITDAMRTALFEADFKSSKFWSELSLWNRTFDKKIKHLYISLADNCPKYRCNYLLQKTPSSPLIILFPSIGESVDSHHSKVFAKMFYDKGYSVLMLGSHFNAEFAKSLPNRMYPGYVKKDVQYLRDIITCALKKLEEDKKINFERKVLLGTSFGAFSTLFMGELEFNDPKIHIDKYISINPPIKLLYAIDVIDKNNKFNLDDLDTYKSIIANAAAKVIHLYKKKSNDDDFTLSSLPFSYDEARAITCFTLRQKLSDLIFSLDKEKYSNYQDLYDYINTLTYSDYAKKIMINQTKLSQDELCYECSLYSIENYLKSADNYVIYHTLDDYLVNQKQLSDLKNISKNKLVLFSNGSHLGYLYRDEFKNRLYLDVLNQNLLATSKK